MARPLRIEFEGATYHVIARGVRKEPVFYQPKDMYKFLDKLYETVKKYSLRLHCYVLMQNHYHLALTTPIPNLSKAIHYLNSSYANWFKVKYNIVGPVFQGRYKSLIVDKDSYLLSLSAYIHLNPLKAGITSNLNDYPWSSYPYYSGKLKPPPFLYMDDILSYFPRRNPFKAYIKFIEEQKKRIGRESEEKFEKGMILGDETFSERVLKMIRANKKDLREYNKSVVSRTRIDAKEIITAMKEEFGINETEIKEKRRNSPWRKMFIYALTRFTPLTLREIGNLLGMDYAAVSIARKRFETELRKGELLKLWNKLEKRLTEKD